MNVNLVTKSLARPDRSRRGALAVTGVAVLVSLLVGSTQASASCDRAKTKVLGAAATLLLRCESRAARLGTPADEDCRGDVSARIQRGFARAEAKAARSGIECSSVADSDDAYAMLVRFASEMVGQIRVDPGPSSCASAKLAAVGRHLRAVSKCRAEGTARGAERTASCVDKAAAQLAARFTKAESRSCAARFGSQEVLGHPFLNSVRDAPVVIPPGYELVEGDMITLTHCPNCVVSDVSSLWPDGVVAYEFDASVNACNPANNNDCNACTWNNEAAVRDAMDWWEDVSPVRFVPRTTEANYLLIGNATGNSSFVGRVPGTNSCGNGALGCQAVRMCSWSSRGVIAHELGHALGLHHEQTRVDRDVYITINTNNIEAGRCDPNFNMRAAQTPFGPYDFESIMHYSACSFSNCPGGCSRTGTPGCWTIEANPAYAAAQGSMGQRTRLSTWDARGMNWLYGGYSAALPNFHNFDHRDGRGMLYGTMVLHAGAARPRAVRTYHDLGNPTTPEARYVAVDNYATRNGYIAGFPTFEGGGPLEMVVLLPRSAAVRRDVPDSTLGFPKTREARFRAVYDYAIRNGFVGGFPNFQHFDYGDSRGTVYGTILIKHSAGFWMDVPSVDLDDPRGFEGHHRATAAFVRGPELNSFRVRDDLCD